MRRVWTPETGPQGITAAPRVMAFSQGYVFLFYNIQKFFISNFSHLFIDDRFLPYHSWFCFVTSKNRVVCSEKCSDIYKASDTKIDAKKEALQKVMQTFCFKNLFKLYGSP